VLYLNMSSIIKAILSSKGYLTVGLFLLRLLGTLDLSLREVISKGKQSVNNALKSKKGEIMTSVCIVLVFPLWYPVILYLGSHTVVMVLGVPLYHVLLSWSLVFLVLRSVALPSSCR